MLHENKGIRRYISMILSFLNAEFNDIHLYKNATDINEIVEDVIDDMTIIFKEKGIKIRKELYPIFLIEANGVIIKEIIMNIIENAIKYSKYNGTILIKSQEEANHVKIEVIDQGVGMSQMTQLSLHKFYRSPQLSDPTMGHGLGLYLAKYFIELHKGKILLKSQEGCGTQVQIYLPIDPSK